MIFFNKHTAVGIFILLSTACSTTPPTAGESSISNIGETALSALVPEGPITPHPYFNGKKASASRAQKQQFVEARSAMDSGQWAQAQAQLESLTKANPKLSGAWVNLGIVLQHQSKIGEAQKSYEQAISANGNNIAAYNKLAVVHRIQGDFKQSLAMYQQAYKLWPYDADTHRNMGILYDIYLGQWPLALAHYQAAQQLLASPDTTLNGWVIDLQRRMKARARAEGGK